MKIIDKEKDSNLFAPKKRIDTFYTADSDLVIDTGDCLDLMKKIPDKTIRLILTSPPYNLGKEYEQQKELEIYSNIQKQIIAECVRVLADNGSICWQIGNYVEKGVILPLDYLFFPIFQSFNLKLRNRIIWAYNHGLNNKKRYSGRYEVLLWFSKTDNYIFNLDTVRVPSKYMGKRYFKGKNKGKASCNPLGKNPSDIWSFIQHEWETNSVWEIPLVNNNHPEKTTHPCQFPIELAERCILAHTEQNDWVLDPFMGVGSTLLAALLNERKVIGFDKESDYVNISKTRIIELFNGTLKYREMGTPILEPSHKSKAVLFPIPLGTEKTKCKSISDYLK